MWSPLRKITLTFFLVALVPLSFMIYELGTVNKNERIVRETYQNQLDAILYSINQYSDDLISSWANRSRLKVKELRDSLAQSNEWLSLFNEQVVRGVYFSDMLNKSILLKTSQTNSLADSDKHELDNLVKEEGERIRKLIEYERAGFRKMEALDLLIDGRFIPILFALEEDAGDFLVGALIIDLKSFILISLAPKMQTISQEEFVISAYSSKNDSLVYSTSQVNVSSDARDVAQIFKDQLKTKDFWILPGYYLGITLKGATIDDLVKDRTATSLIILVILISILAVGLIFLYRNIKREITLSQAKSEFVSNVSHEIRTPLSLIGMFAETLESGRVNSEEKKKEYYGIISKETTRLSRIVNRILDFSQLESNKKTFSFSPINLNDLCQEILATFFQPLSDKGFSFEFIPDNQLPFVLGDREAIAEAIINLLDNAVKYSHNDKHIIIKTLSDHEKVYVEVIDKGIGIERQHWNDIFDQFYRAPTGDIHNTKGSGLGLTLVKKIMIAHNGKVSLESAVGKGSTFRLSFPKTKNHQHEL